MESITSNINYIHEGCDYVLIKKLSTNTQLLFSFVWVIYLRPEILEYVISGGRWYTSLPNGPIQALWLTKPSWSHPTVYLC